MPARAKWVIAKSPPKEQVAEFAVEFGLSPLAVSLAMQRGFDDHASLAEFLYPRLKDLTDPFNLPGMKAAIVRMEKAIDSGESVLIYGDYDVDGVSSLALLCKVLNAYGVQPKTFLPQRTEEGYGLSLEGIEKFLAEEKPELVIAADCGTNSRVEADDLRKRGIDLVILDHHEPAAEGTADCVALVNPKIGDEHHYLCTGGVAFKFAHALLKSRPLPGFDLRDYLDLVALATVADIVPLVDENRIFVRRGLMQIDQSINPGIRALMEESKVGSPTRAHDIGFKLGPRLNAAGRLDTAEAALNLLLADDPVQARRLAEDLGNRNRDRQALELRTREEAETMIENLPAEDRSAGIVAGARGWHPGVVGIVASRIMKHYHRPTFIIGVDEDGIGKGSGRSIPGVSLIAAIDACRDLLEAGGGHEMAAGISLREENIPEFRKRFGQHIAGVASPEILQPRIDIDAETVLNDLTVDLLDSYELLRPFGNTNPQPVFFSRNVQVAADPRVIKDKHLKIRLSQGGVFRDTIYFNGADVDLPRPPWDVAYTIDRNDYRGQVSVTIAIKAIRKAIGN